MTRPTQAGGAWLGETAKLYSTFAAGRPPLEWQRLSGCHRLSSLPCGRASGTSCARSGAAGGGTFADVLPSGPLRPAHCRVRAVRSCIVPDVTRSDWADVRERLSWLAAAPGASAVFGSASHGWRLEPPLEAEDLADLEAHLRIELPGEYRSFLQQAGSGGAGPAYGLFPVRRMNGRWRWEGDGADLTDLDRLDQPFPHVEVFNPADGLPSPPDEADFDSVEEFNEAEDAYWEQHEAAVFHPRHSIGLLYLCHLGCAYREALVISGPARGQMWADDTAGDGGFGPLYDDDGKRFGFARWYRRWLEAAEDQVSRGIY